MFKNAAKVQLIFCVCLISMQDQRTAHNQYRNLYDEVNEHPCK
jgi:hypothetical protein